MQRRPNSRFHGRDNLREIGLLPWKAPTSVISISSDFSWIFTLTIIYHGFRVLSAAFVQILLLATTCQLIVGMHSLCYILTSHHTTSTACFLIILFCIRQLNVICNCFCTLSVKFDILRTLPWNHAFFPRELGWSLLIVIAVNSSHDQVVTQLSRHKSALYKAI